MFGSDDDTEFERGDMRMAKKRRWKSTAIQQDRMIRYVSGKKPFAVALVLLAVFAVCVGSRISYVQARASAYVEQEKQLEQNIAEERARSEALIEYEEYMKTPEFIEEIAEERLGLVHDGDIIFKSVTR